MSVAHLRRSRVWWGAVVVAACMHSPLAASSPPPAAALRCPCISVTRVDDRCRLRMMLMTMVVMMTPWSWMNLHRTAGARGAAVRSGTWSCPRPRGMPALTGRVADRSKPKREAKRHGARSGARMVLLLLGARKVVRTGSAAGVPGHPLYLLPPARPPGPPRALHHQLKRKAMQTRKQRQQLCQLRNLHRHRVHP